MSARRWEFDNGMRTVYWTADDWLDMDPDERNEWATWLERHGIDPRLLALPGAVTANDCDRTVACDVMILNAEGRPIRHDGIPVMTVQVVQLESQALAFPI